MKKNLLFALAIAALASCSEESFVGDEALRQANEQTEKPIEFSTGLNALTRAELTGADAATKLGNNFVVEGVKWNGTSDADDAKVLVFDNYNVNFVASTANTTPSNTSNWEYVNQAKHDNAQQAQEQTIKYWDYAKEQYDFIAYSDGEATTITSTSGTIDAGKLRISPIDASKMNGVKSGDPATITGGAYTIEGAAADLKKAYIADLKTVYRGDTPSGYGQTVQFKFRSLAAKVRIALYETIPGYSVKNVVFYTNATTAATDSKAHLYTTGSDVFNGNGKFIVYFPTTGSSNKSATDYNKAHVQFVHADTEGTSTSLELGALANFATKESHEADGTYLGRSSNAATFAGASPDNYYTVVLPNEAGAVLNLKVNYTLLSKDGTRETINVKGAEAQVPAAFAQWKPGYAYTYLFKITEKGGITDPSQGSAGLYPITFDAVVTEAEDGVQETITTVSEPSITTYAKGAIVGNNDEYTTGSNIYVVVDNGTALTVGTNAKLYTVTQTNTKSSSEDGYNAAAAQGITEASVANVLAHATVSSGTWELTDANNWKMSVTTNSVPSMTAVSEIAAADSPTGNAITNINGAKFTPTAAGTYVFEYIKAATAAVYSEGSQLDSGTSLSGYYTKDGDVYTACDSSDTADGSTTYYQQTTPPQPETKYYKVIKVVAATPAP